MLGGVGMVVTWAHIKVCVCHFVVCVRLIPVMIKVCIVVFAVEGVAKARLLFLGVLLRSLACVEQW